MFCILLLPTLLFLHVIKYLFFLKLKKVEVLEVETLIAMAFGFTRLPLPYLEKRGHTGCSSSGICPTGTEFTEIICRSEASGLVTRHDSL